MRHILKIVLLIGILNLRYSISSHAQNLPNRVKSFVKDLADTNTTYNDIMLRHLCVSQNTINKTNKEILLLQLDETRKQILTENVNAKIELIQYKNLRKDDQTLLIDPKEIPNVFSVIANKKLLFFIYLKNNKIVSFSTINKGGKRILMKYCIKSKEISA